MLISGFRLSFGLSLNALIPKSLLLLLFLIFSVVMAPAKTPPALQEAVQSSTSTWQRHLQSLFEFAKDRFPDVVWELLGDDGEIQNDVEEVWGHKGEYRASVVMS